MSTSAASDDKNLRTQMCTCQKMQTVLWVYIRIDRWISINGILCAISMAGLICFTFTVSRGFFLVLPWKHAIVESTRLSL